jgi:AGZA family xanthine/uracil permease-like MFS transporter
VTTFFDLDGRGTTVGREARGALATFLTMAYILVANPSILSAAGVPADAAVAATALTAGLASILMGLGANVPIALAPGMGLNAFVAFQAAPAAGGWQGAMGLIVLDGVIVLACVLLGLREAVARAIPVDLRRAIGVGLGLFIIFLGLVQAQIVVVPSSTVAALSEHPGLTLPPVTAGDWSSPGMRSNFHQPTSSPVQSSARMTQTTLSCLQRARTSSRSSTPCCSSLTGRC